jgi:hypothetical protein
VGRPAWWGIWGHGDRKGRSILLCSEEVDLAETVSRCLCRELDKRVQLALQQACSSLIREVFSNTGRLYRFREWKLEPAQHCSLSDDFI